MLQQPMGRVQRPFTTASDVSVLDKVALALCPPPQAVAYHALVRHEEGIAGSYTRTAIAKTLHVEMTPEADGFRLRLTTAPPVLHPAGRNSFDAMSGLLASLYHELELRLSPAGELLALLNQPEIRRAWAGVKDHLSRQYAAPDDPLVAGLLTSVERRVRDPAVLFRSLRYDYLYAGLLPGFYAATYETGFAYDAPRHFPLFFAQADLRFVETLTLRSAAPGLVRLRLTGCPDHHPGQLDAIRREIQGRLPPAAPPLAADALLCTYRADYTLDRATGLPLDVRLAVRCATPAPGDEQPPLYSKTYTLTIHQA
jgi:hypothetical protein